MPVKIEISGETAQDAIYDLRAFASIMGSDNAATTPVLTQGRVVETAEAPKAADRNVVVEEDTPEATEPAADADEDDGDLRPVGEPRKGNKRRGKADKAEDDEIEAAAEKAGIAIELVNQYIAEKGRGDVMEFIADYDDSDEGGEDEVPQIRSNPENREPEAEAAEEAVEDFPEEDAAGEISEDDLRAELREKLGKVMEDKGPDTARALITDNTDKTSLKTCTLDDLIKIKSALVAGAY
jgi:hypothetical protein